MGIGRKKTFIPGIWTHSTAVPVALDRNSVNVSSAIDINLYDTVLKNPYSTSRAQQTNYRTTKAIKNMAKD